MLFEWKQWQLAFFFLLKQNDIIGDVVSDIETTSLTIDKVCIFFIVFVYFSSQLGEEAY